MAYDVPTPPAASMGTDFAILGNGEIGIPVHKGPTYSATVGPSGAIADSGPLHQDGPGRGNTDLLEQGVTIEENWMRRTDTRPLIRSAYPEEASNPAPFVRAQVWGEILSRTPPCILAGGDPREQGLGEHGALIGGPGKPPRQFSRDPEFTGRARKPLPLPWFDHPRARSRPSTPPAEVHAFFAHLSGGHLAGYPNRPSGAELARLFRSPRLTPVQRDQVWHVIAWINQFGVRPGERA